MKNKKILTREKLEKKSWKNKNKSWKNEKKL